MTNVDDTDILWFTHGSQYSDKSWFIFPFKSLTFYAPNDTLLVHKTNYVKRSLKIACIDKDVNKWIKTPVMDVLNKKYENIKYSQKKCEEIMQKIGSEISDNNNNELEKYLSDLGIYSNNDINYISTQHIIKIIDLFTGNKTIIKDLFGIDNQMQLIQLRDMDLVVKDDPFNHIYGIWKCTPEFKSQSTITSPEAEPELLYDLKLIGYNNKINLADAFQLLEDTLQDKGIEPLQCHIKMLCCRGDRYVNVSHIDFLNAKLENEWRYGTTSNGRSFKALDHGTNNPTTYTKKSEALNFDLIPLSEENLGLYLDNRLDVLPDLEDGETNETCYSLGKQPIKCDEENSFRKQALLFHPDKNRSCKNSATKKFNRLTQLCKNNDTDLTKPTLLTAGGAKSIKNKRKRKSIKNKRKIIRKKSVKQKKYNL